MREKRGRHSHFGYEIGSKGESIHWQEAAIAVHDCGYVYLRERGSAILHENESASASASANVSANASMNVSEYGNVRETAGECCR